MPFKVPTLKEMVVRAANSFRTNLRGSDAMLYPNNVAVSAKVIGGAVWEAFAFLEYISRQHIKHLAEGVWLERHAHDYGLARLAPTFATGRAVITGDPSIAVPSGLVLERTDGVQYVTTSSGTTDGLGSLTVSVKALVAGSAGNSDSGVLLNFAVPMSRIEPVATVHADGIGAGADIESDEGLRERLLFRLRNPPHGGARHDYVAWVREVNSGISAVYVDPVTEANNRTSVGVWFLMQDTYPPDGIPQAADVNAVKAYIEVVRPAGAVVDVAAPVAVEVDIEISDLATDSASVREAINNELRALFRRACHVSTATEPFTLYRSIIIEAISAAIGEEHHTLTTPAADIEFDTGEFPVLGTITYT